MDAMKAIAQDDGLVKQVIQRLGDQLPSDEREIEELKSRVSLNDQGDLLNITARAGDPALAVQIANTWAEEAVTAINAAYSGEQTLAEVQSRYQSTKDEYDQAQSALEAYLRENQINMLEKKISQARALFDQQAEARILQVAYYNQRKQSMVDLQVQAEALKQQLQNGSRSQAGDQGDALAVMLARARALGINASTVTKKEGTTGVEQLIQPPDFQFNVQGGVTLLLQIGADAAIRDSSANYTADLDGLIQLAEGEIKRADDALNALQESVLQGTGNESLDEIDNQIRAFQTQYEDEQARMKELTSQRDLAWEAYQAMAQKQAELQSATQTNSLIIVASPAVPPEKPVSRGTVRNTLAGAALGLVLGIAFVLSTEWWHANMSESGGNKDVE
jgi:capsular polysaccharide biosynthesis protein